MTSEEYVSTLIASLPSPEANARDSTLASSNLALVGLLHFRFGGHRDKRRCVLCCLQRGGTYGCIDSFNWSLREVLEEGSDVSWKDLKPSLALYRPLRALRST